LTKTFAAATVFSILALPAFAANVIIYDGTGNPPLGPDSVAANNPLGISFTNPIASTLVDVKVELISDVIIEVERSLPQLRFASAHPGVRKSARVAPNAVVGSVTVSLYSSTGGGTPVPASLIANLGNPLQDTSLTGAAALYDFPPNSSISLAGGTRYWIVVSTANASVAGWEVGTDAGTGVPGEFWSAGGSSNPNTEFPYITQVTVSQTPSGTPVPPSVMLTLVGLACLGFYFGSRRFGQSQA
jgi:hypothetical protein